MSALIKRSLAQHEEIIDSGLSTFIDVGRSLMAIQKEKLYLKDHKSFEAYCRKRFDLGRSRSYQLIESTQVVDDITHSMSTNVGHQWDKIPKIVPENEGQARVLADATKDAGRRVTIWTTAVQKAPLGGDGRPRITASFLKKSAGLGKKKTPAPPKPKASPPENGAAHPLPIPEHEERDAGLDETEPEHDEKILDALEGKPLAKLRGVFSKATEFRSIVNAVGAIKTRVTKLHESPAGGWVPMAAIEKHLAELQRAIKFAAPHTECVNCQRKPKDNCKACEGTGWVTEMAYNQTQTKEGDQWLKNR